LYFHTPGRFLDTRADERSAASWVIPAGELEKLIVAIEDGQ
jgi:hypothetical protein